MTDREVEIINNAIENIAYRAKRFYETKLTENAKSRIRKFLSKQDLDGKVRIVFKSTPPPNYTSIFIPNGDHTLKLSYGKNNRKEHFPNILFVSISKQDAAKFKYFWNNRLLPTEFFTEVLDIIKLYEPIKIEAFENFKDWNSKRRTETSKVILIGKEPHLAANKILPELPIGYIISDENRIVLSLPQNKLRNGHDYFTFE